MEGRLGRGGEPRQPQPEILQRFESAVAAIHDSESFRRWLDVSSRFHTYSLGNQLLIAMQRPDATRVAGFHAWRKLGRHVRKGEKGIAIMVPHVRTSTDDDGTEARRVSSFGTGYVFDVSQTEGEPLPEFEVPVLEGDDGGQLWDGLRGFAATQGVAITVVPPSLLPEAAMGHYTPATQHIVVAEHSQRQMTKTLAHELGHHIALVDDRAENECIAEGIAYVVCAHFGLDTGERSFPYVAGWAKDTAVLKGVLQTIQSASAILIDGVAAAMPGNDP
jgi:N-terminal domain of anti-restriction factor ArdC